MATKKRKAGEDDEDVHQASLAKKIHEIDHDPTSSSNPTSTYEATQSIMCEAEGIEISVDDNDDNNDEVESSEEICPSAIPDHIECSSTNINNSIILNLGVKHYLVHYDHILFPYSIEVQDGESKRQERHEKSRVSYIISKSSNDKSYIGMKKKIEELKSLNYDTSKWDDLIQLATDFVTNSEIRQGASSADCKRFMTSLHNIFSMEINKGQRDKDRAQEEKNIDRAREKAAYRSLFRIFLEILITGDVLLVQEEPGCMENKVSFPLWKSEKTISGMPDLRIHGSFNDPDAILALVENLEKLPTVMPGRDLMSYIIQAKYAGTTSQINAAGKSNILCNPTPVSACGLDCLIICRKYCEVEIRFQNKPVTNDDELRKDLRGGVKFEKFHGLMDGGRELDEWYRDIDPSICRHVRGKEKKYFKNFLGQTVGDVLAWFNHYKDVIPRSGISESIKEKKTVRHAIGLIGFKVIFMTVGVNSSNVTNKEKAHLVIGGKEAMGIDVFLTRPFDMMRVDDREKIADIMWALMKFRV